jgi:hypothetical protein
MPGSAKAEISLMISAPAASAARATSAFCVSIEIKAVGTRPQFVSFFNHQGSFLNLHGYPAFSFPK